MLKSKELRAKAWESLEGKYWLAFAVCIVLGFLSSIGTSIINSSQNLVETIGMVDPAQMDETMKIGGYVVMGGASVFLIIGALLSIFVGSPASIGLCNYFIKNTDSKPTFSDAFSGFKVRYGRNVGILLLVGVKTVLWTILFIIPGIIKTYEYSIIPYILADDAQISSKDAFKKAREMMKGNKWRLFKLDFSFIGWFALGIVTCGIGVFFLTPYMNAAMAEFYVELKNKQA